MVTPFDNTGYPREKVNGPMKERTVTPMQIETKDTEIQKEKTLTSGSLQDRKHCVRFDCQCKNTNQKKEHIRSRKMHDYTGERGQDKAAKADNINSGSS